MHKVEIYNDISGNNELKEYFSSSDHISVFQTKYFLDLYNASEGLEGIMFVCKDEGKITGILLVQIQDYFKSIPGFLTRRALIIGGPYTSYGDSESAGVLLEKYREYIGKKVVYTQVRMLYQNGSNKNIFLDNGYTFIDHLNYIVDLNAGEDVCWKNMNPKRRNVRKAIKEGVVFREINYDKDMDTAYDILENIYKRARLPLPEKKYFQKALEVMGRDGIFKIFGGYYKDMLIGVMYVLCYKGIIYEWYTGSYNKYLHLRPNDLIVWEIIRYGIRNGFKTFDFGGAGNPNKEYGVREHKKKFGGIEYNTGRFVIEHKPLIMKIAKTGFRLWQMTKGKK
ncbi:MAG: GNAT family N-acetyltransferase [Ignavibacteria bacterium]|nr:GNAT family N-acetyltransferase [Ignavibacteria bacterium]